MDRCRVRYPDDIENALQDVAALLRGPYRISHRSVAALLLQGDDEITGLVRRTEGDRFLAIEEALDVWREKLGPDVPARIHEARFRTARRIVDGAFVVAEGRVETFGDRLGQWCTRPLTGIPIMLLVLAAGLYGFVGVLGGNVLVELLEVRLFEEVINPVVRDWVSKLDVLWLTNLVVGDYGVWTLGVTYAFGLILPLVGTFFLAFAILEDTGYLPRMAMLLDRLFKLLGLNGRAVIPMVLGFGCDTMATIVTRILETRRERILATFLLSLAIPCSAQLGVMSGLLAGRPAAFMIWALVMTLTFVLVGYLAGQIVPGERAVFVMELPPMRLPKFSNVVAKTLARMWWYLKEVVPLFLSASVVLWVAHMTGLLESALKLLEPAVGYLGLPAKAAEAFLFGFFRRDYGAAGLYRLHEHHGLTGNQLLVACVTLTLFLPCFAQLLVMRKERGLKTSLAMVAFILPFAFGVGCLLNWVLGVLGVAL